MGVGGSHFLRRSESVPFNLAIAAGFAVAEGAPCLGPTVSCADLPRVVHTTDPSAARRAQVRSLLPIGHLRVCIIGTAAHRAPSVCVIFFLFNACSCVPIFIRLWKTSIGVGSRLAIPYCCGLPNASARLTPATMDAFRLTMRLTSPTSLWVAALSQRRNSTCVGGEHRLATPHGHLIIAVP